MALDGQFRVSRTQMGLRPARLPYTLVLMFASGPVALAGELTLVPKVDARVELLSIVFRLAGNDEYNMSPLKNYTADIDSYFRLYRDHPAVLSAKKLANDRGVGFDAVMSMAVHLSPPPSLSPLVDSQTISPNLALAKRMRSNWHGTWAISIVIPTLRNSSQPISLCTNWPSSASKLC